MSNRCPTKCERLLVMLLIVVSVIAFSQSQRIFVSPVYGAGYAASLANDFPINATINANSMSTSSPTYATFESSSIINSASSTPLSTSTIANSVAYATTSVAVSTTASSSMNSYTSSTETVTSVTSSYSLVTTATTSTMQTVNPDFALSVSASVVYLPPGDFVGTTSFTLNVTAIGGWAGPLQFTTSSLPTGIALFNMPWRYWLNSGIASWDVQVAIGPSVWAGSYPLVVTATSGGTLHSIVVTIIVQTPMVFPGFPQFLSLIGALVFTVAIGDRRHA